MAHQRIDWSRLGYPGSKRAFAADEMDVAAWDAFVEHEPEVCFLDIRMPGLRGIDVARRIRSQAQIVFATAHGPRQPGPGGLRGRRGGLPAKPVEPVEPARLAQTVLRLQARLVPTTSAAAAPAPAAASDLPTLPR